MHKSIDVSDLPEPLVVAIESIVKTYREKSDGTIRPAPPELGWMKGKVIIPDSFFDPLPDELLNLFNGGSDDK